ncbi:MAG TPA: DUF1801 domain-containing protein [Chitinophagaceae bacterium]|nr:DUF1801 domain-containing protein [Chitinophagaceae bacterium]
MNTEEQILSFLELLPEPKRTDMLGLHAHFKAWMPDYRLWYIEGEIKNDKAVFNTNIGYGQYTIYYADGTSREFYQIGMSANTTGISVYIMGLKEKNFLIEHFAGSIGKAKVTGYCITFKKLIDIDLKVLENIVSQGIAQSSS